MYIESLGVHCYTQQYRHKHVCTGLVKALFTPFWHPPTSAARRVLTGASGATCW